MNFDAAIQLAEMLERRAERILKDPQCRVEPELLTRVAAELDALASECFSLSATLTLATDYRDAAQEAAFECSNGAVLYSDDAEHFRVPCELFSRLIEAVGGVGLRATDNEGAA